MHKEIQLKFPVLTLHSVKPVLQKDGKVFSYKMIFITHDNVMLEAYENKGLDISGYIGQEMECVFEITKGRCWYGDILGDKTKVLSFKYGWMKRPFEFFPELLEKNNGLQNLSEAEENLKRDSFENEASAFFKAWGLNGLDIGTYQSKPLLNSTNGIFLLNEFEFEEDVDLLQLDEELNIKIDELFLRGIRPVDGIIKPKQKPEPKKSEQPIQQEAATEKKKGRTFFS